MAGRRVFGEVVRSHLADDPIERLLACSGGDVLRIPHGGEEGHDAWEQAISGRDRRRLVAAGLVARSRGLACDVLQHACVTSRVGAPPGVETMGAGEFLVWWCAEGVRGLDVRASVRVGGGQCERDPDEEREAWWSCVELVGEDGGWLDPDVEPFPGEVLPVPVGFGEVHNTPTIPAGVGMVRPAWFVEWRARLVHAPKRELLDQLAGWVWDAGPVPVIPVGVGWADDVVRKFERRAGVKVGA